MYILFAHDGRQIYLLCAPNGRYEWLRFIYCVPLMEDKSGLQIYLLCVPNGRQECLIDLSIVCP